MSKVSVVYRAGEGDPVTTVWRGHTFIHNQQVELDDEIEGEKELLEAARGNPSFDVDGESKADARDAAARKVSVNAAEAQLAILQNDGVALERRQETEMAALEARHQQERDSWLKINQPMEASLRATIRGTDGSDGNEPVDETQDEIDARDAALSKEKLDPDGKPATGGVPGAAKSIAQIDSERVANESGPVPAAKPQERPTDPAKPVTTSMPEPVRQQDTLAAQAAQT